MCIVHVSAAHNALHLTMVVGIVIENEWVCKNTLILQASSGQQEFVYRQFSNGKDFIEFVWFCQEALRHLQ